jgi:hypothetical protein
MKPPNPRCRRVSDLPPSMTPLPSSLTRLTGLRQVPRCHRLHLDLADTVFITMYTCTRQCPKCQPLRLVTRPLVPRSKPHVRPSPLPVRRHGTSSLTFTSPSTTASVLHTCTPRAKRHAARIAFAMVGLVTTQPTSWITLIITHHKTNTQGYLSTLCSQLQLQIWSKDGSHWPSSSRVWSTSAKNENIEPSMAAGHRTGKSCGPEGRGRLCTCSALTMGDVQPVRFAGLLC